MSSSKALLDAIFPGENHEVHSLELAMDSFKQDLYFLQGFELVKNNFKMPHKSILESADYLESLKFMHIPTEFETEAILDLRSQVYKEFLKSESKMKKELKNEVLKYLE